jgi:glycosyltransferase involved in cell wall biosynthesis
MRNTDPSGMMHSSKASLTVAIPTYNRATKAARLLARFQDEILKAGESDRVEILISDNGSPDDPTELLQPFLRSPVRTRYVRQATNLGFDGHLKFLYREVQTDYVWFFGDDDVLFDGGLTRVLATLDAEAPDALLFAFKQPQELTVPQFDYPRSPYITDDGRTIAEALMRYPKLSIYVLRKVELSEIHRCLLDQQTGEGWMFIVLAMSVMDSVGSPRIALISEFLAGSDKDWHALEWTPQAFLCMHRPAEHPFAKANHPTLAAEKWLFGFQCAVDICLMVKLGIYTAHDLTAYDRFIEELNWRPRALLRRPRTAMKLLLIKGRLSRILGPMVRWLKARPAAGASRAE